MSILVQEKYKGIRSDSTTAEVVYIVTGIGEDAGNVSDRDAYDAVAEGVPETWNNIPGSNIEVREELVVDTTWVVAATYSTPDPKVYKTGTVQYEFSFQAPTVHIRQSLLTRGIYTPSATLPANYFSGQINVKNVNGHNTIEGVDLPAGNATNTWTLEPLHSSISTQYQMAVEDLMGTVSKFPLLSRPARTMRLVNVNGGASKTLSGISNPKWNIKFGYQYSPTVNNYPVNGTGITIPVAYGHDYLWGFMRDNGFDTTEGDEVFDVLPKVEAIAVEQIFREENHLPLGLQQALLG